MLQPLLDSTTVPLLEKVALFGERRQQILAGNIANIDTPDYRTRDLPVEEFQAALREAVAQRRAPSPSAANRAAGEQQHFADDLFQAIDAPRRGLTFQDAGNRDIETEMSLLAKNMLTQSTAIELMIAQFNLLQAVISERP